MFVLLNIVVSAGTPISAGIISVLVSIAQSERGDQVMERAQAIAVLAGIVYSFAVLIPRIAVAVRRMHDSGRSGWWIFLPLINFIFLCLDSQKSENDYGTNPKRGGLSQSVTQTA